MKAIFHIHTKYSFDSSLKPSTVVDWALNKEIDYVFITDHNTINGSVKAEKYAKRNKIPVKCVIGSEIVTDIGDIIGIFLKKDVRPGDHRRVIKEIKSQGGVVILPHPYRSHDTSKLHSLRNVDFVETWSGRTDKQQDDLAKRLRQNLGVKPICGCDAHFTKELKSCFIVFDSIDDFKKGKFKIVTNKKSTWIDSYISWFISKIKRLV